MILIDNSPNDLLYDVDLLCFPLSDVNSKLCIYIVYS